MYICYNCGAVFETPAVYEEHHPYGRGYATEEWAICPCCDSTDFEEAKRCSHCGNFFAELEYVQGHEGGLCEECYEDLYGE